MREVGNANAGDEKSVNGHCIVLAAVRGVAVSYQQLGGSVLRALAWNRRTSLFD